MKGAADEELLDVVPEAMAALFPAHAMVWQKVGSHAAQRNATVNKVFPWVLVGLGGGAVISGGICNALAIQDYDDWKKLPENDPKADGVRDSGKAKEITAYVLYGVGGAMIAGGLVWYLAAGRAPAVAGAEFVPLAGADVGGAVRWKW
jgi:energy-converting hydrogenase Eha subunit G